MREYWPNFNMLKLGYDNGVEQTICEHYPSGEERTLIVPEGYIIAGFFGKNDVGYFIRSLGFILMYIGGNDELNVKANIDDHDDT